MDKKLEANKIYQEHVAKFRSTLTPEQIKLEQEMHAARSLLNPFIDEENRQKEQAKAEMYRQLFETPVIVALSGTPPAAMLTPSPSAQPIPIKPPAPAQQAQPAKPASPPPAPSPQLSIPPKPASRQHYLMPLVVKALKARCHLWLVGPAGSGKSVLASNAAAELSLPFASLSVCSQTTKTDFLGYMDAQGTYRGTSFRQAYEKGGVFCLDEVDNGNPNVLAVLNSALSNEFNLFPDRMVKRHPNFIVVACANTFGSGAIGGYVGRTQIDAATLDRFFFVEMPYDDGLESHVAGITATESPKWDAEGQKVPNAEEWTAVVRKVRSTVADLGIKAIVSPRATYIGIALLKQGVTLPLLEKGLLYKGMSADTVAKIRRA